MRYHIETTKAETPSKRSKPRRDPHRAILILICFSESAFFKGIPLSGIYSFCQECLIQKIQLFVVEDNLFVLPIPLDRKGLQDHCEILAGGIQNRNPLNDKGHKIHAVILVGGIMLITALDGRIYRLTVRDVTDCFTTSRLIDVGEGYTIPNRGSRVLPIIY